MVQEVVVWFSGLARVVQRGTPHGAGGGCVIKRFGPRGAVRHTTWCRRWLCGLAAWPAWCSEAHHMV